MISHLRLKYGSSTAAPPLILAAPSVTIFVGPNNSGKSVALREILDFCVRGVKNSAGRVVDELRFEDASDVAVTAALRKMKVDARIGEALAPEHSIYQIGTERLQLRHDSFEASLKHPNNNLGLFANWYLRHLILNLDGPSRIHLVNSQSRGDLKHPVSPLARLLTDDPRRKALRDVIHDSLGLYFSIDMSQGDQLHVRFNELPPPNERTVEDETLEYMRKARTIEMVSDGVKAFVGILVQLRSGDPRIVLIDEPEAFLHPSLASRLGKEIARAATDESKNIFVSTHSPQFIMGAVQSGAKVNIIRLTHASAVSTARLLPNEELNQLMRDPLLRSVGVLSALFYDNVIVTEADADRAFYQEINERLVSHQVGSGIPNALFLNAQGKDTIPQIIAPLRRLGIPAVGIVDIDVFQQGGAHWTKHLSAINLPAEQHQPLGSHRATVWQNLTAGDANPKMDGGVGLLQGATRESVENLIDILAQYGLFVVPGGEIERWLPQLDVLRSKHAWLKTIFEKMGSDPNSSTYVRPVAGDVWAFMERVRSWLVNPARKGVPA